MPLGYRGDIYRLEVALFIYLTRPRAWFRREVSKMLHSTFPGDDSCAAMHVRRSDRILDKQFGRYVPLTEYMDLSKKVLEENNITTIFLLTDSSNVTELEVKEFPAYKWVFVN